MLVAPALYVTTDADLDLLRDYADAGGHLVLGIRTGYADEEARARVEVAPGAPAEAAGVRYEEFSNLSARRPGARRPDSSRHPARRRRDAAGSTASSPTAPTTLAAYEHPRFGDFPAVTTNAHGAGRITVVGTVPSPALAADLVRWAVPQPRRRRARRRDRALPVTVASGTLPDGRRAWFVFNWSWTATAITLARAVTDLVTGDALRGRHRTLPRWHGRR